MLTNRAEFHIIDAAALNLGVASCSLYNSFAPDMVRYVTEDAGAHVIVTELALSAAPLAVKAQPHSSLETVVVIDGEPPPGAISWGDVVRGADEAFDLEAAHSAVQPEAIATLIYTPGTTGCPKGVQLTHGNVLSTIDSIHERIRFPANSRVISHLPMAHVTERLFSQYFAMMLGFEVTTCPQPDAVAALLPEVQPHSFFAPPRLWEKLRAGVQASIASEPDGPTRAALRHTIDIGLERVRAAQAGRNPSHEISAAWEHTEPMRSTVRRRLGFGDIRVAFVGTAPCRPEVIEFFQAIDVPLSELYGMSESTGVIACNPPERRRVGTAGPPLQDVEVELADDGEVLVRGPNVMVGYRNLPEQSPETIDGDGWLHTGDTGAFDDDGYLKVIDRRNELIINAAGMTMSPATIEARLKASCDLIGQACAIGDARPYNVALIVLDPDGATQFARDQAIADGSTAALARDPQLIEAVRAGLRRANERLERVGQIKRFYVVPADWLPDSDELTPNLTLKRKPIAEKYRHEIEGMYQRKVGVDVD
jgi:long-subunit acyl-CoA synthetase (AMP-forming)